MQYYTHGKNAIWSTVNTTPLEYGGTINLLTNKDVNKAGNSSQYRQLQASLKENITKQHKSLL